MGFKGFLRRGKRYRIRQDALLRRRMRFKTGDQLVFSNGPEALYSTRGLYSSIHNATWTWSRSNSLDTKMWSPEMYKLGISDVSTKKHAKAQRCWGTSATIMTIDEENDLIVLWANVEMVHITWPLSSVRRWLAENIISVIKL